MQEGEGGEGYREYRRQIAEEEASKAKVEKPDKSETLVPDTELVEKEVKSKESIEGGPEGKKEGSQEGREGRGGGVPDADVAQEPKKEKKKKKKASAESKPEERSVEKLNLADLFVLKSIEKFLARSEKKETAKEAASEFRRLKKLHAELAKMMKQEEFQIFLTTLVEVGSRLREKNAPLKDIFRALADTVLRQIELLKRQ